MKKLLPILLCLAACDGDNGVAARAQLDFRSEAVEGGGAVVPPSFYVDTRAMLIEGTLSTPCSTQPVQGRLSGSGVGLVLRVQVLSANVCLPAVGYVRYSAHVTGLENATYDVRVVYEYPTGEPQEAGTARVRVP